MSAGYAHTAAIQGKHEGVHGLFALDIVAANLHQFVQSVQASSVCAARFPALRLLCEALEAPRIPLPSADLGERCYMYAGAFALSCPDAGPLNAVFPGLDAALKAESESDVGKGDGFGWTNGEEGKFSTVNLSPVDLSLALGGTKSDVEETKTPKWKEQKQAELWGRLVDPTFLTRPAADRVWKSRLLAAPPYCPAVDWVWVFKSKSKTVYWGGQGKTYFPNSAMKMLGEKMKSALTKNTEVHRAPAPKDGKLSAITFYSANKREPSLRTVETSLRDVEAGAMRYHLVAADDMAKHFAPSLLALMTIIPEREN
jgi:hypothetical protein